MRITFPDNFLWGAGTSSHQVEGGTDNDWDAWERKNAKRLSDEAKDKWEQWQKKKFPEMFDADNYIAGDACDHYNRFTKDFDIAQKLGHNAHRFSIEWSRIEREEGVFDSHALDHYRDVVNALCEKGIAPFVTLWHWTLPRWLVKQDGVMSEKFIFYFERYTRTVAEHLGKSVKFWITINEPDVYASKSFLQGAWPPQRRNFFAYHRVLKQLAKAHRASYHMIKEINESAQVGITKNSPYVKIIPLFNFVIGQRFFRMIKKCQDFIGINYYKSFDYSRDNRSTLSDIGWRINPRGFYNVLMAVREYGLPIYITENGLADADDKKRSDFIRDHLYWMWKAIRNGADVRGYLHWSLLDNFEWDKGFWPRFGLVGVNYKTQERTIRKSAMMYKNIIKQNGYEYHHK